MNEVTRMLVDLLAPYFGALPSVVQIVVLLAILWVGFRFFLYPSVYKQKLEIRKLERELNDQSAPSTRSANADTPCSVTPLRPLQKFVSGFTGLYCLLFFSFLPFLLLAVDEFDPRLPENWLVFAFSVAIHSTFAGLLTLLYSTNKWWKAMLFGAFAYIPLGAAITGFLIIVDP